MENLLYYLVVTVAVLAAIALLLGVILGAVSLFRRKRQTNGGPPPEKGQVPWFMKYLWSILIAIVGVGLAIWGFVTQARPADVGSWSWQYWFPLLVIWGTLAALIALNKEVLGAASKTLQMVLAVGMTVALVILPVWSWWVTLVPIPRQAKQEIPLASSPQSTWPKRAIPEGKSEFISRPPGMKPRIAGYNFTPYVVYADGSECPGRERQCPEGSVGVRVRNNAPGENIIAYAFVPD